jgi:hypothetical protein
MCKQTDGFSNREREYIIMMMMMSFSRLQGDVSEFLKSLIFRNWISFLALFAK